MLLKIFIVILMLLCTGFFGIIIGLCQDDYNEIDDNEEVI